MTTHDDDGFERELETVLAPPSSKRFFVGVGVIAAVLVLGAVGLLFKRELRRLFMPAPLAYDAASHREGFEVWMREAFPAYVVAVSSGKEERRALATAKLHEASAFHAPLAWHSRSLTDAIEDYVAFSRDTLIQNRRNASEALAPVSQAIDDLEGMLRASHTPYAVDASVRARQDKLEWRLRFIARTSEVLRVSRWRAGEAQVEVMRVRRLDNLALKDLTHGKVKYGRATVLEEGPRLAVNGRYLCALDGMGLVKSLGDDHFSPLSGEAFAERMKALLPPDLQEIAPLLNLHCVMRRRALEELAEALDERGIRLIEPASLFFSEGWLHKAKGWIGVGQPDLIAKLERFAAPDVEHDAVDPGAEAVQAQAQAATVGPDAGAPEEASARVTAWGKRLNATQRDALQRASDALTEHFSIGVERHEAWHLLQPEDRSIDGLPLEASRELFAYLGQIADAGDELPMVWDHVLALHRSHAAHKRKTRTGVAVAHLVDKLLPPEATLAGRVAAGVDKGLPLDAHLAQVQTQARKLRAAWFAETRTMTREEP